jgi:transcriptional regulator with XRE-family HTH domain
VETERRISARFRELRELRRLSQPEFAEMLSVTRNTIANIEYGLSPLRYQEARRALDATDPREGPVPALLPFNPLWLAGMEDWPVQLSWPMLLPDPVAIGLSPAFRFSEFVSENLPLLQSFMADSPGQVRLPESWLTPYLKHWIAHQAFADRAEKAAFALMDILAQSALDLAPTSAPARRVFQQFKQTNQGSAFLEVESQQRAQNTSSKQVLTEISDTANLARVKSPLAQLLERLNQATAAKGTKAELARHLKAPRPCVSDWLSGKRKPGGETTLRLLHWVEQQERQQKQSPGSVSPPPGPQTQLQESYEKKPRSSPQER